MADEKPIWQRIEGETDKAFDAFCTYRDLGADRSLEKTRLKLNKDAPGYKRVLADWSVNYEWVKRVSAYDDWVADEHSRERIKRQKKVEANAWKDYEAIRRGIEKRISIYEELNWKADHTELSGLLSLMKSADDLARRAVSLPDKITENKTEVTGKGGGAIEVAFPKFVRAVPPDDSSSS